MCRSPVRAICERVLEVNTSTPTPPPPEPATPFVRARPQLHLRRRSRVAANASRLPSPGGLSPHPGETGLRSTWREGRRPHDRRWPSWPERARLSPPTGRGTFTRPPPRLGRRRVSGCDPLAEESPQREGARADREVTPARPPRYAPVPCSTAPNRRERLSASPSAHPSCLETHGRGIRTRSGALRAVARVRAVRNRRIQARASTRRGRLASPGLTGTCPGATRPPSARQ
jgi:hypothetical protein